MHNSHIIILFLIVTMVAQVAWARCICDPADTLCLDGCVNSARDCIEGCDGKSGDSCFTSCVNVHWPGATFEDAGIVVDVPPSVKDTVTEKVDITPTTDHMVSFPTTTKAVGVFPTVATTTAGPADDLIPFLMSIFGDLSNPKTLSNTLTPTNVLTELPTPLPSSLTLETSDMLNVSSLTSQFSIDSFIPSFTTTHTTVTSLVTVTPNLTSISDANNNNTSHGMKNPINPWTLFITCFFLLFATFSLV